MTVKFVFCIGIFCSGTSQPLSISLEAEDGVTQAGKSCRCQFRGSDFFITTTKPSSHFRSFALIRDWTWFDGRNSVVLTGNSCLMFASLKLHLPSTSCQVRVSP